MPSLSSASTTFLKHLVPETNESDLALSVLSFAIIEARQLFKRKRLFNYGRRPLIENVTGAHLWITTKSEGFMFWCEALGLDPEYVHSIVMMELNYYEQYYKNKRNKCANDPQF
jgi:hypothetical protein